MTRNGWSRPSCRPCSSVEPPSSRHEVPVRAASAANATVDHMRDWVLGTPEGGLASMAVPSDGYRTRCRRA